jgi:hypothetical protein
MIARPFSRLSWGLLAALLVLAWARPSAAEDRLIVRGNYYREQSTRVLQPLVHVTVDAPDERLTLGAAYLLDAISSASIATGTTAVTGGDNVFTELRHEATGTVASRLGEWSLGGFFRYSTETDYISRALGASVARDLLQRSITLSLSYAYNFDRMFRITNNLGARSPWCGGSFEGTHPGGECSGKGFGEDANLRQVHYVSAAYTHALHKTVLALASIEGGFVLGPQDNPYRGEQIPNVLRETHPLVRKRLALSAAVRWIVPQGRTVFEPRYTSYVDDWGIKAHSIDTRVHFRVARHVRARVRYRFYTQSEAFFWRDDMMYLENPAACTRDTPEGCASADPKLDDWLSHTPGLQVTWELDGLARFRGLGWLENGWIQGTYNHVFQTNRFGYARLGSLAFSVAW